MSEERVDSEALREAILGELKNRLTDPIAVKELPGTGLIQLAKELFKQKNEALTVVSEEPDPDVLDLVQSPGLPKERKHELLVAERLKAISRVTAIERALEDLND